MFETAPHSLDAFIAMAWDGDDIKERASFSSMYTLITQL